MEGDGKEVSSHHLVGTPRGYHRVASLISEDASLLSKLYTKNEIKRRAGEDEVRCFPSSRSSVPSYFAGKRSFPRRNSAQA